jgi:hypothetical protein
VELFNLTGHTVDLTGWRIEDNCGVDYIPGLLLPPHGFAVIAAAADFRSGFPGFTGDVVFVADGNIGNGLNNDGDRISVVDPAGRVVDALSYGSDDTVMSPPCPDTAEGHSLERLPAGLDTDQASDFVDNAAPSPGRALALATPTGSPVPTPVRSPTPTAVPTPGAVGSPTPVPLTTPVPASTAVPSPVPVTTSSLTPSPFQPLASPADETLTGLYVGMGILVFLAVMTFLLAVVLWLRRRR